MPQNSRLPAASLPLLRDAGQFTSRAYDICLGAALVFKPEHARDGCQRHFLTIVKREHCFFSFIQSLVEHLSNLVCRRLFFQRGVRAQATVRDRVKKVFFNIALEFGGVPAVRSDNVQRMIARHGEKPGRELGLSLEGIQILINLGEDFLCQIGGGFAVVSESQTPATNLGVIALEQFVDVLVSAGGICRGAVLNNQLLVGKLFERHASDYSNGRLGAGCRRPRSTPTDFDLVAYRITVRHRPLPTSDVPYQDIFSCQSLGHPVLACGTGFYQQSDTVYRYWFKRRTSSAEFRLLWWLVRLLETKQVAHFDE